MIYDKSGAELHIGLQGMHLSAFWDYVWKRKGNFNSLEILLNN